MDRDIAYNIKNFEKGDLIKVSWFDANDYRGNLKDLRPEILVDEWGVFLGTRGKPKHILLGKYHVPVDHKWEATCIPLTLIKNVDLLAKHAQRDLRRCCLAPCSRRTVSVKDLG